MKPVSVSVDVPQRREDVYDYLDVLDNHRSFTDHFLVDWSLAGADRGAGARARMLVKGPRLTDDWLDMEVVAAERPWMSTEESVSAKGRRRTRGTYLLERLPAGGTRIVFEFSWLETPLIERLAAPLTRGVIRRANAKSLHRLAEKLASSDGREEEMRVYVVGASGVIGRRLIPQPDRAELHGVDERPRGRVG